MPSSAWKKKKKKNKPYTGAPATSHASTLLSGRWWWRSVSPLALSVCGGISCLSLLFSFFFFFNDTATTEIYTLSLHAALPICAYCRHSVALTRPLRGISPSASGFIPSTAIPCSTSFGTYFDAPGAGTSTKQGTAAFSINKARAAAGVYVDAGNVAHGFVRAATGTITPFDVPGAGTGASQGTYSYAINAAGTTAGRYVDASQVILGFVRAATGTITPFDAPGAGPGANQGTTGGAINKAGAITGWYIDASDAGHGFVRAPGGTITTFDPPGTGTGANQVTSPDSINMAGDIAGWYLDANSAFHGFRAGDRPLDRAGFQPLDDRLAPLDLEPPPMRADSRVRNTRAILFILRRIPRLSF